MRTVSVVLCTYNGADHLSEQLASVAAQTASPVEILIADDGSTDRTLEVAALFAAPSCSEPTSARASASGRAGDPFSLGKPLSHDRWLYFLASTFGGIVTLPQRLAR